MPLTPTHAPTLVTSCKVVPVVGAELKGKSGLSWGAVKLPIIFQPSYKLQLPITKSGSQKNASKKSMLQSASQSSTVGYNSVQCLIKLSDEHMWRNSVSD